jgi:UDP-N-acetylglucosamine 4,6-dehydratase
MTRFWISIEAAVEFVLESLEIMKGGELYVPRIPSMKIIDLAEAVAPGSVIKEIGMRPGEKLHEEMISADDSRRTFLTGNRYVVTPVVAEWGYEAPNGISMPDGIAYQSHTNDLWMSQENIHKFLMEI